ncbi:hypothetical protein SAMN04487944_1317 [Gracilibacillus ureilyticus]|uniref:Uncharacterized protein n=1 Tax=Gracilibacillus ureilyticus TaxID=531814 RepID=A0A1H9W050_9BACI|nr:hypothetical protein [Gracilibacillus ureilyticus]SES27184.1 hypothetical protein SAMN04487944_1317 [Gracilibacillus ureilyticus]
MAKLTEEIHSSQLNLSMDICKIILILSTREKQLFDSLNSNNNVVNYFKYQIKIFLRVSDIDMREAGNVLADEINQRSPLKDMKVDNETIRLINATVSAFFE